MDAIKDYDEVSKLAEELLKGRKQGSDFKDAIIEDSVNYLNGHLDQINRYIKTYGDFLDNAIAKQKKTK